MKKAISIILLTIFILSIGVSAADYHIEWFDIPEGIRLSYAAENYIVLYFADGYHYFICDENGKIISDTNYTDIKPFNSKGFILAAKENVFTPDFSYYIINSKGETEKTNSYQKADPLFAFYDTGKDILIPEMEVFESQAQRVYHAGKYVVLASNISTSVYDGFAFQKECKYALAGENGELLTGFDYDRFIDDLMFTDVSILYNTETDKAVFFNRHNGNAVYGKMLYAYNGDYNTLPIYVYEDQNGKIKKLDGELNSSEEYDKFIAGICRSVSFEKDGKRYVYDENSGLAYNGSENVIASLSGRYIISENGRMKVCDKALKNILASEYDYIEPVSENVFIAEQNGKSFVLNNGKKITEEFDGINSIYNYLSAYNLKKITGAETGKEYYIKEQPVIYDFEGNIVYDGEGEIGFTKDNIIIAFNDKTGKLVSYNSNPHIKINGEYLYTDTLPRIRNNITLVAIRAIAEKLGFEVAFKDGEIKITKDGKEIIFNLGSRKAIINGEEKELSAPPEIINDRTLVPIRAVAEAFEMKIEWNEGLRVVELMHNS